MKTTLLLILLSGFVGDSFAYDNQLSDAPPKAEQYSVEEVAKLHVRAEKGELLAAQSLFTHYCLETDDMKLCDYWMLRSAQLGDENMRCSVIQQYRELGKFAKYKAEVKKLRRRGQCKQR
ncbi:hypothetical protein [Pseudoduganella sp. R-34]|uniref:hypothetical protein n=1 Tax=Pseudoduganella sp. R-34 TaxID=3404062 RepID=UPI003CF37714